MVKKFVTLWRKPCWRWKSTRVPKGSKMEEVDLTRFYGLCWQFISMLSGFLFIYMFWNSFFFSPLAVFFDLVGGCCPLSWNILYSFFSIHILYRFFYLTIWPFVTYDNNSSFDSFTFPPYQLSNVLIRQVTEMFSVLVNIFHTFDLDAETSWDIHKHYKKRNSNMKSIRLVVHKK